MGRGYELPKAQVGVSRWRRFRARFDWPLFLAMSTICLIGLLNLYSATFGTRHAVKFDQQVVRIVIGAVAFFAATFVDYRTLVRFAWPALGLTVVGLIVVWLLGDLSLAKGSHRWIAAGPIRIQPSELVKIAVILVLAKLLQDHETAPMSWRQTLPRLVLLAVPVLLIAMQPDLGSSIMVGLIIFSIGFLSMRNLWPLIGVSVVGLLCIPILWENMHTYQRNRVFAFLDPSADPTGSGWHTRQSIFAVGSGRVTGKGFMEGTQNQFDFLPEHWTDFPFSVWAEEWGFLGSIALLAAFCFLLFWIMSVAMAARERAGSVICIGVAALLFWHMVVNIAMVLGMAPVVGVTLPFISYGGSSLIVCLFAVGMVSSVSLRRHGF
ncbi:rod shape-determining protein RodA [Haliangium ochraceum]|uniref:Cell wall polymerase n=1 Tax=Haliangium ochraceum (strain DSM 14365 / JCM 11303 / SMP-2) TaxID=502025 RepID=D0LIP7_HALO1|nr:rod shape-determining protein RodA [Haliangium ochraceum]ACY18403.1 rod shape-determining protein RodA [Haliangium ochraceum DSM 14365]